MKELNRLFVILMLLMMATGIQAQEQMVKVLCIGNSFTFFHDSNLRLEEIAASQGHNLKTRACTVGGYTFQRHLNNDNTCEAVRGGGYDVVFLQDQSQSEAIYAEDTKAGQLLARDAAELAERVRIFSPKARVWLEQTWAYEAEGCGGFGTMENFDSLLREGTRKMAKKARTMVSPIGEAFAIARTERPDIDLYDPDRKHQSTLGTYLKSCVNYLLIYGEAFHGDVANCGYDAEKCAFLRSVAERVVLK